MSTSAMKLALLTSAALFVLSSSAFADEDITKKMQEYKDFHPQQQSSSVPTSVDLGHGYSVHPGTGSPQGGFGVHVKKTY